MAAPLIRGRQLSRCDVVLRLPKYQGYQGQSPWLVREQRRARILVCDDDVDVCSLVGTLLRELGHTVWEAPNPILALQILERKRPLDLLLVDYAMPEMNGRDVIDRARRYQPSLKMLLMTGYAEASHNNGMSGIPILPKPFKAAELTGGTHACFSTASVSRPTASATVGLSSANCGPRLFARGSRSTSRSSKMEVRQGIRSGQGRYKIACALFREGIICMHPADRGFRQP